LGQSPLLAQLHAWRMKLCSSKLEFVFSCRRSVDFCSGSRAGWGSGQCRRHACRYSNSVVGRDRWARQNVVRG
jgi:hypothetical protein